MNIKKLMDPENLRGEKADKKLNEFFYCAHFFKMHHYPEVVFQHPPSLT